MTATPTPEGLLLIDKPAAVTSHDVVDMARKALDTRKVGHAGTLDPMATGLLLIGVGRATRLLRYLSGLGKTYEGTGLLGIQTDTLDAEGGTTATDEAGAADVTSEALTEAMVAFTGDIEQVPPQYSAVKVGGRALYQAARRGQVVEAPPRTVHIAGYTLDGFDQDAHTFDFTVTCSGGTYVRTLVADTGGALGCGAHLTRLRRTSIGPFVLDDASAPDAIDELLPIEAAVAHLPRLDLSAAEADAAAHGRPLGPAGIEGSYGVFDPDGHLIGMYVDRGAKAVPEMILAPAS